MPDFTLASAQQIVGAALAHARTKNMKPLAVAVLDARGALKAYAAEDKTSLRRFDIARGKAYGAIAMGIGSRTLGKLAVERPHFVAAVGNAIGGTLIPVAGGVLIKTHEGEIVGAVGISGDTSDNDEAAATAGIAAAGFKADPGSD
jgi:uncharacterized protein GlcG (DUF336 family)